MTVYYTLPNGEKISIFFWDDYYPEKEAFHTPVEVTEIDTVDESGYRPKKVKDIKYPGELVPLRHNLKLHTAENGQHYIMWKGDLVYLDNFDYLNIRDLIKIIEIGKELNDRYFISDNMILVSLMKQSDKFGILIQPRVVQCIIPGIGIGLVSGDREKEPIIFIPKIEPMREVEKWYYKIKLQPKDENLRAIVGTEDYYFSSLCSMLKSGHFTLVEI